MHFFFLILFLKVRAKTAQLSSRVKPVENTVAFLGSILVTFSLESFSALMLQRRYLNLAGRHYLHCLPKFGQLTNLCKTVFLWKEVHFYQLDSKLVYVHLVVHLSQVILCEVLDLHLQTQTISLNFSYYLLFLQQYPLLLSHSAFQFASGWQSADYLYCMLLTVSWWFRWISLFSFL